MAKGKVAQRGAGVARSMILLGLLLAACGPREPAPVITGAEAPPPPTQIIVQRGQTLSGIAQTYHVPMAAVAEANRLSPPYRILVGQALIIPGGGGPAAAEPQVAMAGAPPPPLPQPPSAAPLHPPEPGPEQPIPLDRPPPVSLARSPVATAPPEVLTPPTSPSAPPAASAPALTPPTASAPAGTPTAQPHAPGPTASAEPPAAPHGGGIFLWPVRGHVLENYGAGADGTHNDGINIAAARGAPVQAADAGTVAYSGNELRGYGNLILIKHANGWISAYAHCDLILVKTGQKVGRGQVIARVGSTGNVSEPQLHFELRRGKRPVDPRDYLAPLPTAAAKDAHSS